MLHEATCDNLKQKNSELMHSVCVASYTDSLNHIKTHSSESQGQEEAGLHDEPVSYLQVENC